jgi:hypothetical protein
MLHRRAGNTDKLPPCIVKVSPDGSKTDRFTGAATSRLQHAFFPAPCEPAIWRGAGMCTCLAHRFGASMFRVGQRLVVSRWGG